MDYIMDWGKNYKFCFGRTSRYQIATNKVIADLLASAVPGGLICGILFTPKNPEHSAILPFQMGNWDLENLKN